MSAGAVPWLRGRGQDERVLEDRLKRLPAKPGVYLFRDAAGEVLYVGKAKSLRPRVRSYFQKGGDGRTTTRGLRERIADLEVIVTGSEAEALHVEQSLVKRHRPPFNVRLRDDKSFPFIAVTVEDDYPRVMFTRERHRPGVVYFGPYANAKKVRETLDVLNRVFRYRPCEGPQPGRHSGVPCLDFHIDRCHAPCVGNISRDAYREVIDGVVEFLSGETKPIQRELEARMQEAAAGERFEEAARYRNRLFSIRHLAERQAAEQRGVRDVDVIGIAAEGERAAVQLFPLRDGRMVDRYSFHLENVEGDDVTGAARDVLPRALLDVAEPAARDRRAAGRGRPRRRSPRCSRRARLAGRGAARAARREAAARRPRGAERAARARVRRRSSRRRSGRAAPRRSRSCARR